ncbi:MAG: aspartate kinase [Clostridiales bacterium]|nr:aspartate kinase [Clostridiales bacterium]
MLRMTKFGGSSLADANQFHKVKAILEADKSRQFVVPSAPGKRFSADEKITDLLYLCQSKRQAGEDFGPTFDLIRERYLEIESDLGLSCGMDRELTAIARAIENNASADYAASRGEYLNGILLAAFLGWTFMDANELICFHDDGTYDDETTQLWSSVLEGRSGVVVPGFYGRKRDGSIRTFSRGGSDITGAIIARAVRADVYENWTDVSGFLMADPRIVENPRVIDTVTYSELRELSYMGATVLHEDAIFPVRKAKIPIQVRNTNEPEVAGTMIVPDARADKTNTRPLTGVAGRKGFTILTVTKDNMHNEIGFGYRLLRVIARNNITFEHVPSGIDTMSLVVHNAQLEGKLETVLDQIRRECDVRRPIEISTGVALIATVGKGMVRSKGVAARLFSALYGADVNIRVIDQGSSEMNIIVGVEDKDFETAIRAIYKAFA